MHVCTRHFICVREISRADLAYKDARDDLRTQLFEPAASRKDDVPLEAQSSAQSSRTAPEETKL